MRVGWPSQAPAKRVSLSPSQAPAARHHGHARNLAREATCVVFHERVRAGSHEFDDGGWGFASMGSPTSALCMMLCAVGPRILELRAPDQGGGPDAGCVCSRGLSSWSRGSKKETQWCAPSPHMFVAYCASPDF